MNLLEYLSARKGEASRLSRRIGTSAAYLSQIAHGHRKCSEWAALAIERETAGAVTVAELRPDFDAALAASGYVRTEHHEVA